MNCKKMNKLLKKLEEALYKKGLRYHIILCGLYILYVQPVLDEILSELGQKPGNHKESFLFILSITIKLSE